MKRPLLPPAPLLPLAVSLMVGIVLGDGLQLTIGWGWLIGAVVLTLALRRWAVAQSVAIGVCVLLLGMLLVERQERTLDVNFPDEIVDFCGIIVSEPVEKPKTVAADVVTAQGHHLLKCYIAKDSASRSLHLGDGLCIRARIDTLRDFRRGTFSYRRYLQVHGFAGQCFVRDYQWRRSRMERSTLTRIERSRLWFLGQRERLLSRYRSAGACDDAYGVVAAMTLGDKSALRGELKEVYAVAGASHVLALSGLHLGIIYALLSLLMRGRRWRVLSQTLLVAGIWAFALLVGLPASVVRAATMLTVCAVLSVGGRRALSVNVLAFAAIAMLLVSPQSLFDVGFQLSFAAMFSILVGLPLLQGWAGREWLQDHRLLAWAWGLVAVSLAAQAGTAPLVAYYFGRLPVWFLLTNFIVVPAAYAIVLGSLLVLAVPVSAPALLWVADALNATLQGIARLPLASIAGLHPSPLQVLLVYVAMAALYLLALRQRRLRCV